MAKYTVLMSCGHEETIDLVGKVSERYRKIDYFKENGLCKECYKKKMEEESSKEPFNFNATVLPYINEENGNILLNVWFSGNTKPYKDNIKSLGGFKWSERSSADDYLSLKKSPMCWNKNIELDDLKNEIQKAKSIGAESIISDDGLFGMINYGIAIEKHKEWEKKYNKIKYIKRHNVPEIIGKHDWNWKIYGKSGNYSIYLDGEKIVITDKQAEELEEYIHAEEEYKKDIQLIKNGTYESVKGKEEEISKIKKPHVPDVLNGHRWNQKIYGKSGNYTIYPDNVKTGITDEEAEEIRKYLKEKEEYKKKVEEVKNDI